MPIELQRSLWFDDALEGVGFRRGEAVKAFEGDEDLVGAGVGDRGSGNRLSATAPPDFTRKSGGRTD